MFYLKHFQLPYCWKVLNKRALPIFHCNFTWPLELETYKRLLCLLIMISRERSEADGQQDSGCEPDSNSQHACLNPVVSTRTPRLGPASTGLLALVPTTNCDIIYKFCQKGTRAQCSSIKLPDQTDGPVFIKAVWRAGEKAAGFIRKKTQDSMWFICFKQTLHGRKESVELIVISLQ